MDAVRAVWDEGEDGRLTSIFARFQHPVSTNGRRILSPDQRKSPLRRKTLIARALSLTMKATASARKKVSLNRRFGALAQCANSQSRQFLLNSPAKICAAPESIGVYSPAAGSCGMAGGEGKLVSARAPGVYIQDKGLRARRSL